MRAFVVWERVTPSDRPIGFPGTHVLARVPDPRVEQFWDRDRLLSQTIVRDLPADTLRSLTDSRADAPLVWDSVALFRPGVRWEDRFPVPDWAGRPVADVADSLRRALDRIERLPAQVR